MANKKTIAETFAARFGDCGETWTTPGNIRFDDVLAELGATAIYSSEDPELGGRYEECCHTEYKAGDPIWHVFADGSGWTDIVRYRRPDQIGPYSWWSQRGKAFDNDAGWRIDYHVVSDGLVDRAVSDRVDRASAYDMRWSDHAPVTVVYE